MIFFFFLHEWQQFLNLLLLACTQGAHSCTGPTHFFAEHHLYVVYRHKGARSENTGLWVILVHICAVVGRFQQKHTEGYKRQETFL